MDDIVFLEFSYVVDAIIWVKQKRFNENYASVDECILIKQKIQQALNEYRGNVIITENINYSWFHIDNVITVTDDTIRFNLNNDLYQIVYDETFIYMCLCEIMLDKLAKSMQCNQDNITNSSLSNNDYTLEVKKLIKQYIK